MIKLHGVQFICDICRYITIHYDVRAVLKTSVGTSLPAIGLPVLHALLVAELAVESTTDVTADLHRMNLTDLFTLT